VQAAVCSTVSLDEGRVLVAGCQMLGVCRHMLLEVACMMVYASTRMAVF